MLSLSLCKLDTICEGLNELIPNFARFQIATCSPCEISDVQSAKKNSYGRGEGKKPGGKVGPELLGQETLRGGRVELEGLPGAEQVEEGRADRNSTSFF